MTAPGLVTEVASGTGKALSLKNLLILTIVTIVVTLIVSKALKQTVVLTNTEGQAVLSGEIKTSLKYSPKAA
ncbi:MAG: hypothetical protein K0B10_07185 [Vicingaceae bacterium]|nr:hypothetical protein [Vicingaceae bacterium]